MTLLERSRTLHARVREFARASLVPTVGAARGESTAASPIPVVDTFATLAREIFEHQTARRVASLHDVLRAAVPADSFRFGGARVFAPSTYSLRFVTSGTTGAESGVHYMRERETYECLSLLWGELALGFLVERPRIVVALAPWTGRDTPSSLGYMMQRFMEHFDGRPLHRSGESSQFVLDEPGRWLIQSGQVDLPGLRRLRELAWTRGEKVTLLATSFALVELLDAARGECFELPPGSVIMPTGGFKGRTRTVEATEMFAQLRGTFGDIDIVGEYGMTELTSQLYEGTARAGVLRAEPGVYLPPPWLEVHALDPITLEPLEVGQVGLACFIDLGNVDSAVCVLTQDLVRAEGSGIRLLGRQPKAPLRGCSLAVEALFRGGRSAQPHGENCSSAVETGVRADAPALDVSSRLTEAPTAAVLAAKDRIQGLLRGAGELRREALASSEQTAVLAQSCGLSLEGVRMALRFALESDATEAEVDELVAVARQSYRIPQGRVWVLLSSNVFTAPLRAIALAAALCEDVRVRPSRRDPAFTHLLHGHVPGAFTIVDVLRPEPGDVVLAFGSDETLATVARSLPANVGFFGHGHGIGIAVLGARAATAAAAKQLAFDVALFDQRGCSSPRLALVDANNDVPAFVKQLSMELEELERQIPVGPPTPTTLHERAWERRVGQSLASVTDAGSGWVTVFDGDWAERNDVPLPRTSRCVSLVVSSDSLRHLAALRPVTTNVGFAGPAPLQAELRAHLPGARIGELGRMQRLPLDGPVDRRHL